MWSYLVRRLLLLVPVLLGLTVLVFAIARLLPGDPVALAAGPNASPAEIAAYGREFGLDRPLWEQYGRYLWGLLQGDLGVSIYTRRPVIEDLRAYLPATLELVLAAMTLAVLVGVPMGLWAAVQRDRWPDYLSRVLALGAISMPRFFLGLLLQLLGLATAPTGPGRRRQASLWLSGTGVGLIWVCAMPLTSRQLIWGLEERSAALTPVVLPRADAVVVLGGGLRPAPTPAGVPVRITLPASRVVPWLSSAIRRATEKIIVAVFACCTTSPLRRVVSSRFCRSAMALIGTGCPRGQKLSKLLPRHHWPPPPLRCQSRAETSLAQV